MQAQNTTKTGTNLDQLDRTEAPDNGLWGLFRIYWPTWIDHVDRWEVMGDDSIMVYFKEDGYITNGAVYVFGVDDYRINLQRVQKPKPIKSA